MSGRRREGLTPTLLPFMAVLICTLGTMILLLALVAQRAGAIADSSVTAAADESDAAQQVRAVKLAERRQLVDQLQRETDEAAWHREQTLQMRAEQAEELERHRDQLAYLEDHLRRLRDELLTLDTEVSAALDEDADADDTDPQTRLAQLQQAIEAEKETIARLEADRQKTPPRIVIVPHQGPNGTDRRPIYIECGRDGVVVQPGNIAIRLDQLEPVSGWPNPLEAALRTIRLHAAQVDGDSLSPYPLLVVRPDGILAYGVARSAMSNWDDQFGYELVPADMQLAFPEFDPELSTKVARVVNEAVSQRQQLAASQGPAGRGGYRVGGGSNAGNGLGGGGVPSGAGGGGNTGGGLPGGAPPTFAGNEPDGSGYPGSGYFGGGYPGGGYSEGRSGGQSMATNDQYGGWTGNASGAGSGQPSAPSAGGTSLRDYMVASPQNGSPGNGLSAGGTGSDGTGSSGTGDVSTGNGGTGSGPYNHGAVVQEAMPPDPSSIAGLPHGAGTGGASNSGVSTSDGNSKGANGADPQGADSADPQSANDSTAAQACDDWPAGAAGQPAGPAGQSLAGPAGAPGQPTNAAGSGAAGAGAGSGGSGGGQPAMSMSPGGNAPLPPVRQVGKDWALPPHISSSRGTEMLRVVRVECLADRFRLIGEGGRGTPQEFVIQGSDVHAAAMQLATAVRDRASGWGAAMQGARWQPVLEVAVATDADLRYRQLADLLDGSGLILQPVRAR